MGSSFSHCFKPPDITTTSHFPQKAPHLNDTEEDLNDVVFQPDQPLDDTLGHSFCYVRTSNRFISPSHSDRFLSPPSPSLSLRFDDRSDQAQSQAQQQLPQQAPNQPIFRTISGASVSANTSTPRTTATIDSTLSLLPLPSSSFDCTPSFSALPLQPAPRGTVTTTNLEHQECSGFFLSGPIERGALSGPLESIPFSAPLSLPTSKKKKRRKNSLTFGGLRKSFLVRSFSEKKRLPWVVPAGEGGEVGGERRRENGVGEGGGEMGEGVGGGEESNGNVQWALGKAGEDRVHVVVSEEHGWLFVGIYDGFNGPDAPEFLMGHLYKAVFHELKGLFWDEEEEEGERKEEKEKKVRFREAEGEIEKGRRKLWEYLAEEEGEEDGLDLSGSDRFAFSVDDAVSVSNVGSSGRRRRLLLLSRLKQGWSGGGGSKGLFQWRFREESGGVGSSSSNRVEERGKEGEEEGSRKEKRRRRKAGPVEHGMVLRALEKALERTENGYLELTEKVIDRYPELALMGSCLLVVLMRDEDVYVMNLGDSRAIVAQSEQVESCSSLGVKEGDNVGANTEGIVEENSMGNSGVKSSSVAQVFAGHAVNLTALQLSTDHSTSIEEEVLRIKREHPDDKHCIVKDRVKGRLKVTRAFGAGFLKQPKFNETLLEMFRNEFIGNSPYVSCIPSLRHHSLGPRDQFLVLSSDGLYQYLTNQEVVAFVENFLEKFPDGDPAQHLIEELLNRAAKKAGMDFHELLDIPQGDRRKYHDDVTVMVISLEGRIWKSSGKYP